MKTANVVELKTVSAGRMILSVIGKASRRITHRINYGIKHAEEKAENEVTKYGAAVKALTAGSIRFNG